MKKLLFILVLCIGFVSCSDDDSSDDNPIANLEIPQSSVNNPIKSGEAVTIKGEGFTQASEIWLRSLAKSTESDVKAEIISVIASGISFIAPAVSGERNVVLKQSGQEYSLGKIYFENPVTPSKRLKKINSGDDGYEYVYNDKGQLSQFTTIELRKNSYRTEFIYNAEGKLIKVTDYDLEDSPTGIVDEVITINYKDAKTIEVRDVYPEYEEENRTKTLTLNDKGQIISMILIFDDLPNDPSIYTYTYDESGNITRIVEKDGNQERVYVYTYDDKKSYAQSLGIPLFWIIDGEKADAVLPIGANNIKTLVHLSVTYTYTYEYDSDGYPTKGIDGYGDPMTFTYEVIK